MSECKHSLISYEGEYDYSVCANCGVQAEVIVENLRAELAAKDAVIEQQARSIRARKKTAREYRARWNNKAELAATAIQRAAEWNDRIGQLEVALRELNPNHKLLEE